MERSVTDKRISDLVEHTASFIDADMMEMVDTSNTTDHATGSSFKVSVRRLGLITPSSPSPAPLGSPIPNLLGVIATSASVTAIIASERIYMAPMSIRRPVTITSVGVCVSTLVNPSIVRIGVYNATDDFQPGSLVADFGTVDSSTTGRKFIASLSQALPVGNYFMASCSNAGVSFVMNKTMPHHVGGLHLNYTGFTTSAYYSQFYRVGETSPSSGLPSSLGGVLTGAGTSTSPGINCPVLTQWTEP
jgi:hypothetical protein